MKKESKEPKTPKENDERMLELTADLQRVQADFMNFRRRSDEEKIRAVHAGKEQAVLALLPVLDNIERAIAHEPADIKDHAWVKGVSSIAQQLDSQLAVIGLRKIGAVGEIFDPSKHEAVGMNEEAEGELEVVAAVLQPGYQLGETVIRPAMVNVTKQ
jgi:molecular chaperone GrpE